MSSPVTPMQQANDQITCRQAWEEMNAMLSTSKLIRNFSRRIVMNSVSDEEAGNGYTVETDLFPINALAVYSAYNLGDPIKEEDRSKYFSAHRGGSQGDYRDGIQDKIMNVIDCLKKFPSSKRAVITIPNNSNPNHSTDDDAKCMREMHFYLDGNILNATVLMRAQASEIFPKNIHFIGSLMDRIARPLNAEVGELFYLATTLVSVRED